MPCATEALYQLWRSAVGWRQLSRAALRQRTYGSVAIGRREKCGPTLLGCGADGLTLLWAGCNDPHMQMQMQMQMHMCMHMCMCMHVHAHVLSSGKRASAASAHSTSVTSSSSETLASVATTCVRRASRWRAVSTKTGGACGGARTTLPQRACAVA